MRLATLALFLLLGAGPPALRAALCVIQRPQPPAKTAVPSIEPCSSSCSPRWAL